MRTSQGRTNTAHDAESGQAQTYWFVAHTKPRCEKKLKQFLEREGLYCVLPTIQKVSKYRGKTATFNKPLFPGYLFLNIPVNKRQKVYQSDYVANLLDVPDQEEFYQQLEDILMAVESGYELQLAPEIGIGKKVLIRSGPMRGIEGWVENRLGMSVVMLRLDFIGQAAAMSVDAEELELI